MFARIRWSKLAQGVTVDQALAIHRERILPSLQTHDGFLGSAVLVNRDMYEGVTASYWQTAEALAASETTGNAGRAEAARAAVVLSEVDRFQMLLSDRAAPANVGAFTRVNDSTAADREASEAVMGGLRKQAAEVAGAHTQPKVSLYEVAFVETTTGHGASY